VTSKVVLADRILGALTGQAAAEKMLSSDSTHWVKKAGSFRSTQDALSLIILFDRLLLPVHAGDVVDIPVLRDADALEVFQYDLRPSEAWSKKDAIFKALEPYESVRPFVLNRLMKLKWGTADAEDAEFDRLLAAVAKGSRRTVYDAIIRYAIAFYREDKPAMEGSFLGRVLPSNLREEVLDAPLRKRSTVHVNERAMRLVAMALLATGQISSFLEMAIKESASIASGDFGGTSRGWSKMTPAVDDVESVTRGFFLLRCAIHEEGRYFREIRGIKDALRLRKDPSLKALKTQLNALHEHLKLGDCDAVRCLREEGVKAKAALERSGRFSRSLRWVTYLSLPVAVAEAIAIGAPVLSTCMSVYAVAATAAQDWAARKHGWLMFGAISR